MRVNLSFEECDPEQAAALLAVANGHAVPAKGVQPDAPGTAPAPKRGRPPATMPAAPSPAAAPAPATPTVAAQAPAPVAASPVAPAAPPPTPAAPAALGPITLDSLTVKAKKLALETKVGQQGFVAILRGVMKQQALVNVPEAEFPVLDALLDGALAYADLPDATAEKLGVILQSADPLTALNNAAMGL